MSSDASDGAGSRGADDGRSPGPRHRPVAGRPAGRPASCAHRPGPRRPEGWRHRTAPQRRPTCAATTAADVATALAAVAPTVVRRDATPSAPRAAVAGPRGRDNGRSGDAVPGARGGPRRGPGGSGGRPTGGGPDRGRPAARRWRRLPQVVAAPTPADDPTTGATTAPAAALAATGPRRTARVTTVRAAIGLAVTARSERPAPRRRPAPGDDRPGAVTARAVTGRATTVPVATGRPVAAATVGGTTVPRATGPARTGPAATVPATTVPAGPPREDRQGGRPTGARGDGRDERRRDPRAADPERRGGADARRTAHVQAPIERHQDAAPRPVAPPLPDDVTPDLLDHEARRALRGLPEGPGRPRSRGTSSRSASSSTTSPRRRSPTRGSPGTGPAGSRWSARRRASPRTTPASGPRRSPSCARAGGWAATGTCR